MFLHGHQLARNVARPVTAEAAGTFVLVLAITSAAVAAALSRPVAGAPAAGVSAEQVLAAEATEARYAGAVTAEPRLLSTPSWVRVMVPSG